MLVDTSVWIDHLRRGDAALAAFLTRAEVECHPFVIGELACGSLRRRSEILDLLAELPKTPMVTHDEAMAFVNRHRLWSRGIGWIDVHLLASAKLAGAGLWTRDRPLMMAAKDLAILRET